ncbi:MAG: hypothetical protein A4E73_00788 [Syntrophaceae bacterium PtaU1.Bin231]|nr:MAG: hypothetical protein A4E73_00788 [Syntrophaceae bacterium PtaU1.Bin231]HOG18717.1 hypothetical protein [Syntrophales bacterium]
MRKFRISLVLFAMAAFLPALSATATEMNFDVTPKAKLVKLNLQHKELIKKSSEKMIVFEITLQNTDSAANLYSITVDVPGVGAAEDFIPVEGEKKLEPKAVGKTSVGVASDKFPPEGFTIRIEAVESR